MKKSKKQLFTILVVFTSVCGKLMGGLVVCLIIVVFLGQKPTHANDVQYFDIQGLRLNMKLDEIIKALQINHVKSSKDKFGIIHGYEIVYAKGEMKTVLNFTGEKRLYRIDFTNQYQAYKNNSMGILESLKKKYGEPSIENIEVVNGESRNIHACWGTTCNKFTPTTPALKSTIDYASGRLKLTLVDNQLFNEDWNKYKESRNSKKSGVQPFNSDPDSQPGF